MNILISVIIPTYNRAGLLKQAIQSVLDQTYQTFEILIVDDGSDDETKEVVSNFEDERIIYIPLKHTGLISLCRNVGLERCAGEYIAFLDSDDFWHPNKLESQAALLQDDDVGFTYCEVQVRQEHTDINDRSFINLSNKENKCFKKNVLKSIIFNKRSIYPSSLMIKKNVLDKVNSFDTSMSISETKFLGQISVHYSAYVDPNPRVIITKHVGNTSKSNTTRLFEEKFDLARTLRRKKYISLLDYNRSMSLHYYAMSLALDNLKDSMNALKSCLSYNPFFFKAYYRLINSYFNPKEKVTKFI